ncbi:MAG: ArsR/SmtB family transcription factor [Streptosporangiaceae bacterium]
MSAPEAEQPAREPEAAVPGTPENPLTISDPRMLRALAHPARIAILQFLVLDGPATATQCAEVAGLSPSACSYHLRALARHGFVQEEPASAADGRHRPWRARITSVTFDDDPGQPAALRTAGQLVIEAVLARVEEIRAEYAERQEQYPAEWTAAAGQYQGVLHVTAAELAEIQARLRELFAGYLRLRPQDRPPGAQRVHVLADLVPWFDPAAASAPPGPAPAGRAGTPASSSPAARSGPGPGTTAG